MIRVDVVIEALGRGGAERLLVDTARLVDRSRIALRVCTVFPVRRDYEAALRELEVPLACLGVRRPLQLPLGVLRLLRLWREDRPDLVHTHLFAANLIGRSAAFLAGLPVVSTLHDADYEPIVRLGNPGLSASKQRVLQLLDATTARLSRCEVVGVSRYVAEAAERRLGVPPKRVTVIANAVDTERFVGDAAVRERTRRMLDVLPHTGLLLCIGRLTPQKGQALLLEAVAALPDSRDFKLLLVGDGALRPSLELLVQERDLGRRVQFLGVRTDIPDLVRASDVVVLPTLHEGFGLVLVEALACEVPVVATRTGPIPEIVKHDESGLLFEIGDVCGLRDALDRLLSEPLLRGVMGRAGRADVVSRFSMPIMIDRLLALYERMGKSRIDDGLQPGTPLGAP